MRTTLPHVIILLSYPIHLDSRAQRTAITLSKNYRVTVAQVCEISEESIQIDGFNENVSIFGIRKPQFSLRTKIIRHSFFYREFDFMAAVILTTELKADLIYCHDLPTLKSGVRLKKTWNAKLLYDCHEIYTETINQFFSRNTQGIRATIDKTVIKIMRLLGGRFERKASQNANLVFTVNISCAEHLTRLLGKKVEVVPNYPDLIEIPEEPLLRKELNLSSDNFIVLYQGMLNEGRHLREIVISAESFPSRAVLVIIGSGQLIDELRSIANPEKVIFKDYIPYKKLFAYTSDANLGIMLNEPINLSKHYALANKVIEYAAAGIPCILSNSPEHVRINNQFDYAYILSEITSENISNLVSEIANNAAESELKSKNARRAYTEELNWSLHEGNFLKLVADCL